MFRHHLQHLEILWKCVRSAHFNEIFLTTCLKVLNIYFFFFKSISGSSNCNVAMKYFAIFYKNVVIIFQLQ